jgi:hypothetical protein
MVCEAPSIAEAPEGELTRLAGRVRPLHGVELLSSPLTRRPCVYHEVRDGPAAEPAQQGAQDFFIEDGTGRALVVMERCQVFLDAQLTPEAFSALDADVNGVADRIRRLKNAMREGDLSKQQSASLHRLRELATLLCSIRAHSHGKVHGNQGTLGEQAEVIRRLSEKFAGAKDVHWVGSLELRSVQREIALEPGSEVVVAGVCHREPDPDPSAADDYRRTPLRLVVRAPAGGYLEVHGVCQGSAVSPTSTPTKEGQQLSPLGARPSWGNSWLFWTALSAGGAVAFWLLQRLW